MFGDSWPLKDLKSGPTSFPARVCGVGQPHDREQLHCRAHHYLRAKGATDVVIKPRQKDKGADIVALLSPADISDLKLGVQVKWHEGETAETAVRQSDPCDHSSSKAMSSVILVFTLRPFRRPGRNFHLLIACRAAISNSGWEALIT